MADSLELEEIRKELEKIKEYMHTLTDGIITSMETVAYSHLRKYQPYQSEDWAVFDAFLRDLAFLADKLNHIFKT